TMLVDHGVVGAALYIAWILWTLFTLRAAARLARGQDGFAACVLPALAGVMVAIIVGDLFVQYPILEARIWFTSLLISYRFLLESRVAVEGNSPAEAAVKTRIATA